MRCGPLYLHVQGLRDALMRRSRRARGKTASEPLMRELEARP